jgi:hypothetical protein
VVLVLVVVQQELQAELELLELVAAQERPALEPEVA